MSIIAGISLSADPTERKHRMATKRAASISIKDFSAAVEKAARTVAEKNKTQFASGFALRPTISGKVARPKDLAQAQKLATDLTRSLSGGGGPLAGVKNSVEPAVLIHGGEIICGFIAPEGIQFRE
jgi:hypothetical protein